MTPLLNITIQIKLIRVSKHFALRLDLANENDYHFEILKYFYDDF